ncbi:1 3-beta-glucanosyltransferase gel4 [Linderina pennispora]|nr:1 3-beta-glucanosyltransferase gel4 [Linderina pennispora]
MRFSVPSVAVLGSTLLAYSALAINPLVIKGAKWFDSKTGEQFFAKGVDYQPDIIETSQTRDPLASKDACDRDLPFLKDLGVNAIRVYQTEPYNNHDYCMKALADAGIYVMLDLSTPTKTINRDSPAYDADLLGYYYQKVDAFGVYDNVMGFLAGNEVANAPNNTDSAAYVKAALRDVRAYIKKKGLSIPVGYATNDDADIRWQQQTYFDCNSKDEQAEFYGLNIYSWCGEDSSYTISGYDTVVKNFTNWDVPVMLTEYGCNTIRPRTFPEIAAIYGSNMTGVFSGGFVYEYVEEDNKYGLVTVSGTKGTKTQDYDNFKKALKATSPKGVTMSSYSSSAKLQSCPSVGMSNSWMASSTLPPTPNNATCACMMKTLSCVSKDTLAPTDSDKLTTWSSTVGDIFSYVCASIDCSAINGNGTTGKYGNYAGCDTIQRVSWALNAYYQSDNKKSTSCDFDGFAKVVTPSSSSDSKCANSTDDSSSGSSSSGNSSSGSKSNSKSSDAVNNFPSFTALTTVAIVAVAAISF